MSKPLIGLCVLYAGLSFFLARQFPPVSSDEVVRAVMGRQWVHHETARYSLYDDVFAPSVYPLRDVLPEVSLTLYHAWLGIWTSMKPSSFFCARLSSIAAGVLALIVFYGLGVRVGGPRTGLWCAALAGFNPLFLTASCVARPETLLAFTSAATIWLALFLPERVGLKPFILGALAMAQMSVHPNASVLCLGLFVFYVYPLRGKDRYAQGALFIAGALAGLLAALLLVDARRLWLGMHTVHAYLLRPPIFAWPWTPWQWGMDTVRVMWEGRTFYFDPALAFGWRPGLQMSWLALAVLVGLAGTQVRAKKSEFELGRWLSALAAVLVAGVALIKAKECLYGTNLFPFLIPIAASAMTRAGRPSWRIGKGIACALAGAGLFSFLYFSRTYAARVKSYAQVAGELRTMLPPGPWKLAGPNVLWFAWDQNLFRDSGAILISHWYTGGGRDLKTWLAPWRPDILVLDEAMENAIRAPGSARPDLKVSLGCPVDFLGTLESPGAYGRWDVYQIRWPQG